MKRILFSCIAGCIVMVANHCLAAREIDLTQVSSTVLSTMTSDYHIEEYSRVTDFNQVTHIRFQQYFAGYPVWNSEAIMHLPEDITPSLKAYAQQSNKDKIRMDGIFYQDLERDLTKKPTLVFTPHVSQKVLSTALHHFKQQYGDHYLVSHLTSNPIIYVNANKIAHWAFSVTFRAERKRALPVLPIYVVDAETFKINENWNDLKTNSVIVKGGGIGGNERTGRIYYDGQPLHRATFDIERDGKNRLCYLQNTTAIIKDFRNHEVVSFRCSLPDSEHNNVYWNTVDDAINGSFSPNNDAIYSDKLVRDMYLTWFGIPMLMKDNQPMRVTFYLHDPAQKQNAYYEDEKVVLGDGDDQSYSVAAPSVIAHEMSHGFTEQQSKLRYRGQSGGMNESFSDMADKALEYFSYGKNNWDIDAELVKDGGHMLRYMDEPTKDCGLKKPGNDCSISHVNDYEQGINVHHSSGIFNKIFYLLATKWDTHKAFQVMVQANISYWTPSATFANAACGVLKAARDYKYDQIDVREAMSDVGISTDKCNVT
jgi:pseudolysin